MEQSGWDFLIQGGVLLLLGLFIISRVAKMTMKEMLISMKEFFTGETEELIPEAVVWNE